MFDSFFDCLNGRAYSEGRKKRKPNLLPFRTPRDTRLEVLLAITDIDGYILLDCQQILVVGTNVSGISTGVAEICG